MNFPTPQTQTFSPSQTRERQFLRGVGGWMMLGILVTAAVALFLSHNAALMSLFYTSAHGHNSGGMSVLGWIALLGPLLLVWGMRSALSKAGAGMAVAMYLLITVCFGITMAPVMVYYPPQVLISTLLSTSAAFGGFALWGFFTKTNLRSVGRFAFMGLIGLIVLGLIQIFWPSSMLHFLLGVGGLIVFTLLTAWDMQRIHQMAQESEQKWAIYGALALYLDFINLFWAMLNLMGGSSKN